MKVGDWIIHDCEIKQIGKMEEGRVCTVSCGFFSTGGSDIEVRRLTMQSKVIADTMYTLQNRIREFKGQNGLNWPDIHRHFVDLCYKAIDYREENPYDSDKGGPTNPFIEEAENFVVKVRTALSDAEAIDGVRLFR